MKKQMILEIDETALYSEFQPELQKAISDAGVEWPEAQLLGTSAVNGKHLILILTTKSKDDLHLWMKGGYPTGEIDEEGEEVTINFNLDWNVVAEEGQKINQNKLLPYFDDVPVFDENGDQVGTEPVTELDGKLQTWAGHKWQY